MKFDFTSKIIVIWIFMCFSNSDCSSSYEQSFLSMNSKLKKFNLSISPKENKNTKKIFESISKQNFNLFVDSLKIIASQISPNQDMSIYTNQNLVQSQIAYLRIAKLVEVYGSGIEEVYILNDNNFVAGRKFLLGLIVNQSFIGIGHKVDAKGILPAILLKVCIPHNIGSELNSFFNFNCVWSPCASTYETDQFCSTAEYPKDIIKFDLSNSFDTNMISAAAPSNVAIPPASPSIAPNIQNTVQNNLGPSQNLTPSRNGV